MSRKNLLSLFLAGMIAFSIISCHSKNIDYGNSEFSPQRIRQIRDGVAKELLPVAFGKNRDELDAILKHLDRVQKESPAYFEDSNNIILLLQTGVHLADLTARLHPENFDKNLYVSLQYLRSAQTIKQFEPSEKNHRLIEEYEKKGVRAAEELVEKFPGNGVSYGNLAHSLYITGGDEKRSLELFERCLELDKDSEFCRQGYDALRKK